MISTTSCSVPYLQIADIIYYSAGEQGKSNLCVVDIQCLCILPVPHVSGCLGSEVAEDEQEQLVVVPLVGEVASEILLHRLHDGVLLSVDEALQHNPHGHVNIVLAHKLPQMHLGMRLSYPNHAFDVPRGENIK